MKSYSGISPVGLLAVLLTVVMFVAAVWGIATIPWWLIFLPMIIWFVVATVAQMILNWAERNGY